MILLNHSKLVKTINNDLNVIPDMAMSVAEADEILANLAPSVSEADEILARFEALGLGSGSELVAVA